MPAIAAAIAAAALLTPTTTTLSDEWATNVWAHPVANAPVHATPGDTKTVAHLHAKTEMGSPEIYLMLSQERDERGRAWVRIRVPGQPNGRTGWVRRATLGRSHVTHTALLVDKHTLTATLLRDGQPAWKARIGVGTATTPTPAGRFYVRELLKIKPATTSYGPYIFGTSGYAKLSEFPGGGIIGVHGTSEPGLIPGRPSHGCVRLRNADIRELAKRLPLGAAVRIRD